LVKRSARKSLVEKQLKKEGWEKAHNLRTEQEAFTIRPTPPAWWVTFTGYVSGETPGTNRSQAFKEESIVAGNQLLWIKLKSLIYVGCCTRYCTEYYLPFVVAAIPVFIWAFKR